MIMNFTRKEVKELRLIANATERDGFNKLKEALDNNKLISYSPTITGVEIKIKPEYMEDFLSVYGKFTGLFINQLRALYETVQVFQQEVDCVFKKHTEEEEE